MKRILKVIFFVQIFISTNSLFSQNNYCRWNVCEWGNDCMEGPEHIYGRYHPGCKTQWIKNNPEEWKAIQKREAAQVAAVFKLIFNEMKKDKEEERKKEEIIRKAEIEKKKEYVQTKINKHLKNQVKLNQIYKTYEGRKYFAISFIILNNLQLTKTNIDKFSKIDSLINYIENYYNKIVYKGKGLEFKNFTELPSNLIFLPNVKIPSYEKFVEIKLILKKHHQNFDFLKSIFNTTQTNSKTIIKKFEVFKTFDLPLDEFKKINSFNEFLNLYAREKKKKIINFRNLGNVSIKTQNIDFLNQNFTQPIDKNSSIVKYFFGNQKNYNHLSFYEIENIIEQNISSYVEGFSIDSYKKNNFILFELNNFLSLSYTTTVYELSGKKHYKKSISTNSRWSYNNSLISPYNRYFYFKDFAIIYDALITDIKKGLEAKKMIKNRVQRNWDISFYDYLQNENNYLINLKANLKNRRYISYDTDKGYLTFNNNKYDITGFIPRGTPLHKVVEQVKNQQRQNLSRSFMIFSSDDILKGQKELMAEMEILEDLLYTIPPSTVKKLVGYAIDDKYFMTFWDFSSFNIEDQQLWIKLSDYNKSRSGAWEDDQRVQKGASRMHYLFSGATRGATKQLNSNNLIFISGFPKREPSQSLRTHEEKLSKIFDIKVLDSYLGLKINKELNSNGEKINFFISNTKNITEFYNSLNENSFSNIKVEYSLALSDKLKLYNEGMNLFFKTLLTNKFGAKSFQLEKIKSSKRKNESVFKIVEYKKTSKTIYRTKQVKGLGDEEIKTLLVPEGMTARIIKITYNKSKVVFIAKDDITDLVSKIELQLENVFGGDWYLKKAKPSLFSSTNIFTWMKK